MRHLSAFPYDQPGTNTMSELYMATFVTPQGNTALLSDAASYGEVQSSVTALRASGFTAPSAFFETINI